MTVEEKMSKIHKEIIPKMISPYAEQLLSAIPVTSEIMEKMGGYLSACDYDLDSYKRDLSLQYENKSKSKDLFDKTKTSTILAYIEKDTLFNKPYVINFREASNGVLSHDCAETTYVANFKTGDILKNSETVAVSADGKNAISKTITNTEYSREGVMTKTESKTFSRPGSFITKIEEGEFIPEAKYGYLTHSTQRYRDERCPFVMHEVDPSGELIRLVRLDDLTGLDAQTDDITKRMYSNLLYERLGPEEYKKMGINKDKTISELSAMLDGDMPATLKTSFSSVEEAIEYVSRPDIKEAIKLMLDNQFYDMQPNAQPFLRDSVDSKGHGNMYKRAFINYVSRLKEKSNTEPSQSAGPKKEDDVQYFDY